MRVLFVQNIPTPYRIPLFNRLAGRLTSRDCSLHVVFGGESYDRRRWDVSLDGAAFESHVLDGSRLTSATTKEAVTFRYRGLLTIARKLKPAVIVVAGFGPATVKAAYHRMRHGTPFIIWSGAIGVTAERCGPLRTLQRRALVRMASGFVAYGSRASQYLCRLGARRERISIGINTVDTGFFAKFGTPETNTREPRIVVVGDLSHRKRPDLVLYAVSRMPRNTTDFRVDFVGDGDERGKLEALAADLGLSSRVVFHGFLPQQQVAELMANSRCFAFPTSHDVWGLVLIEAMAAGLPCVASTRAGATADAVVDGVTGFAVDFDDPQRVADCLSQLLIDDQNWKAMSESSRTAATVKFSLDRSVDGFVEAIDRVSRS